MSLMNFLKSSTVEEVKTTGGKPGGLRKQWNPPPAIVAIRVWKDGSIFPSKAAVDKFDLEYRKTAITKEPLPLKDGETEADRSYKKMYAWPDGTGNGFDFIDSRQWNQVQGDGAMLFVAVVPKNAGKVDLFNTVSYEEDGTPKVSVLEQGAVTFGQQVLIPAVEQVYGIRFNRDAKEAVVASAGVEAQAAVTEVTDGVDFVDLAVFESIGEFNVTEKYSKPILHVPKLLTRGKDKGKSDYERREGVKVYGLAPAEVVLPNYKADNQPDESKVVADSAIAS
jgi:hypothetical protein